MYSRDAVMSLGELPPLPDDAQAHLRRLMAGWGMLADLCVADLLLLVPVPGAEGAQFTIIGQMRPTTGQTLHRDDLVGRVIEEPDRPLVAGSWRLGEIVEGEQPVADRGEPA